jgi:hypothetical protein
MKKLSAILLIILISSPLLSQGLLTEDFNYPVRDSIEGLGGWNRTGLNSLHNIKVVTPGLTYPGYVGSGIGNCVTFSNHPDGDIVLNNFTTQTTGSIYMSCMVRVDSMTTQATQSTNIGLDQAGGSTNLNTQLTIQRVSSTTFKFGIRKIGGGGTSYTAVNYNINTTYLAVVKYSFYAGANNDTAKVYIFSSGVPATEPVSPEAFAVTGNDAADIGQVYLSNQYSQGSGLALSSVKIDGLRIGTTWGGSVLAAISVTSTEVPKGYYLGQNFPNPFNPVTNIYFSIPKGKKIKITVTDILGKEVGVITDGYMNAGSYKASYDASGLSSGIYFYRLESNEFSEVKKMTLVK